jgi:hypothetical protein
MVIGNRIVQQGDGVICVLLTQTVGVARVACRSVLMCHLQGLYWNSIVLDALLTNRLYISMVVNCFLVWG